MCKFSTQVFALLLASSSYVTSTVGQCIQPTGLDQLSSSLDQIRAFPTAEAPYLWFPLVEDLVGAIVKSETPFQFRIGQRHGSHVYNAVARFHPTALDIWGRDEGRICQPPANDAQAQADFDLHLSITAAYTFYWSSLGVVPQIEPTQTPKFESLGFPANLLDTDSPDPSTPWGIAVITRNDYDFATRNDGWNADGKLTSTHNSRPFSNFDFVGANGVKYNSYKLDDRPRTRNDWPWVPLMDSDGAGYFSTQEFVAPFIGYTSVKYGMTAEHYESFTARPPSYVDYKDEVIDVLNRTRIMATNDEQKVKLEFFDSKFTSLLPMQIQWSVRNGQSEIDFWYHDVVLVNAMYMAALLVWKEKVVYNRARPTTVIHALLGDELVETYAGPFEGVQTIRADEWQSYIRTMPHPEYPSGSACICTAHKEAMQFISGSDEIGFDLGFPIAAGASISEPGVTPNADITLLFGRWSDVERECGQSRLYGGMHFGDSVPASHELCTGFVSPILEKAELLLQGNSSGALAPFGNDRDEIYVSPLLPEPRSQQMMGGASSNWYPNWEESGSTDCLNDGNAPYYMRVLGTYFENSLDACCQRFFGWASAACTGRATITGYYPNWGGGTENKCLSTDDATAGPIPNYLHSYLEEDVGTCCQNRYNWAYDECISLSGGG